MSQLTQSKQTINEPIFKAKLIRQSINQSRLPDNEKFMSKLQADDCNLLSLDSLLQVNEAFEPFKVDQGLDDSKYSYESGNLDETDESLVLEFCHRQDIRMKDVNIQLEEGEDNKLIRNVLTINDNKKINPHYNNIEDIMNGNSRTLQKLINKKMSNQIGDTFGDYTKIKQNEDFELYRRMDKGYLIQFEH